MSEERIFPWDHPDAFGLERTEQFNGRNCVGCGRFRKGIRPSGSMCKTCRVVRYWPIFRPREQGKASGWYGFDENGEWIWDDPDPREKGFV
jgi:hypothetical protein